MVCKNQVQNQSLTSFHFGSQQTLHLPGKCWLVSCVHSISTRCTRTISVQQTPMSTRKMLSFVTNMQQSYFQEYYHPMPRTAELLQSFGYY